KISSRSRSARRATSESARSGSTEPASSAAFLIGRPCYSLADAAGKGRKFPSRSRRKRAARAPRDRHELLGCRRSAHETDRLVPDLLPPRRGEKGRRGHRAPDVDQHDHESRVYSPVPPLPERVSKHALDVLAGIG